MTETSITPVWITLHSTPTIKRTFAYYPNSNKKQICHYFRLPIYVSFLNSWFVLPVKIGNFVTRDPKINKTKSEILDLTKKELKINLLYFADNYKNYNWQLLNNAAVCIFYLNKNKTHTNYSYVAMILSLNEFFNIKHLPYLGSALSDNERDIRPFLSPIHRKEEFTPFIQNYYVTHFFIQNGKILKKPTVCSNCSKFMEMTILNKCDFGLFNCIYNLKKEITPDVKNFLSETYVRHEDAENFIYREPYEPYNIFSIRTGYKPNLNELTRIQTQKRLTQYCCNYCIFGSKSSSYSKVKLCGYSAPPLNSASDCGGPYFEKEFTWRQAATKWFLPQEIHILTLFGTKVPKKEIEKLFQQKFKKNIYVGNYLSAGLIPKSALIYEPNYPNDKVCLFSGSKLIIIPYPIFCKILKTTPVYHYNFALKLLADFLKKRGQDPNKKYFPIIAQLSQLADINFKFVSEILFGPPVSFRLLKASIDSIFIFNRPIAGNLFTLDYLRKRLSSLKNPETITNSKRIKLKIANDPTFKPTLKDYKQVIK